MSNSTSTAPDASFDVIIVGGGAAGCVMASRLSERSGRRVLLLESGQDFAPGSEPADLLDIYPSSYYNKDYMWPGQKAYWRTRTTSPAAGFDQGHVIGGGSSVMGMVALRGVPDDYEEWEALGAQGWGWRDVLPFFRKLESDLDYRGDLHGEAGPVPIRRVPRASWTPLARAASEYADNRQIRFVDDMNGAFQDGYCALPMSNTKTQRGSSALCYLTEAVRRRSNLTIIGAARVTGLLFEGTQVTGVRAKIGGAERTFAAVTTVLCAGAIHSPAILLRAGIGPAEDLQPRGVSVVADRPGVGANLQNHPVLFIGGHLRRTARQSASLRTLQVTCFRFSSGLPDCPPTDMFMHVQSKSSWNALGGQIANFGPVLWKPLSRGRVSLAAEDGQKNPLVEFNFADHRLDLERLMLGFGRAVDLVLSAELQPLFNAVFPVQFNDRLRLLNRRNRANAIKTTALAGLLNAMPGVTSRVLGRLTSGGKSLRDIVADRDALAAHVLQNVAGTFHICGTCRMGNEHDRDSVVDVTGRVHGVAGLRVADASVMPRIPRGNTNIPTLMLAEKIAAAFDNAQ